MSVAATTRHVAEDALDLIEIDYEPLPHVSDVDRALAPGAPVIHGEVLDSNLLISNPQSQGDVEARRREADVVVEGRFYVNRVTGLPMETRAVLAEWQPGARQLTVHVSTQVPHLVRKQLAESLRLDEGTVRVVASDVGGGFGLKLGAYPEDLLGEPPRHVPAPPGQVGRGPQRALPGDDAWAGVRARLLHRGPLGRPDPRHVGRLRERSRRARIRPFGSSQLSTVVFNGPYKVDDGHVERRVVVTNKTPIGAYRGYGQPEVNFAYERMMDRLARRLDLDPVELRARNMVRPDQFPWVNPTGAVYDSGDYERCLRMAADAVDYSGHRRAGHGPGPEGRYRGIGFSCYVERTGYASAKFLAGRGSQFGAHESVTLRATGQGASTSTPAVSSIGQGSETVFAQMCADFFGIDYDAVTVHAGDTATRRSTRAPSRRGPSSRPAGALRDACQRLRAQDPPHRRLHARGGRPGGSRHHGLRGPAPGRPVARYATRRGL